MMKLSIERGYTPFGVFGEWYVNGESMCSNVERPWLMNQSNISCIPEGDYTIEPYDSPTHGECYIIYNESLGVTKFKNDKGLRWGILVHTANLVSQLAGCIAPATSLNSKGGSRSRDALNKLKSRLGKKTHTITISHKTAEWL